MAVYGNALFLAVNTLQPKGTKRFVGEVKYCEKYFLSIFFVRKNNGKVDTETEAFDKAFLLL